MITRDQLLADLQRALAAFEPDAADRLLREIEVRLSDDLEEERRPLLSSEHLLESITWSLRRAFPDRAGTILTALRERFEADRHLESTVVDPPTPTASVPETEVDPSGFPRLVVIGPSSSRYFAMSFPLHLPRMRLGRSKGCDLFLWEDTVSRQHVEFVRDGAGRIEVHDLASTNGCLVNGAPVTSRKLDDGDHIRCGRLVLRFVEPTSAN